MSRLSARSLDLAALVVLVASIAAPARAQERSACGAPMREWAAACAAREGIALEAHLCDDGVTVLVSRSESAAPLSIELRADHARAFRRAGGLGLTPIAEVPDWREAPRPWRGALDAVEACARREPPPDPSLARDAGSELAPWAPTTRDTRRLPGSPWRAVLGAALLAVLLMSQRRRLRAATLGRPPWLVLPAIALATWLVRRALHDDAYFHPNGQGPIWIDFALCHASGYGPGYRELYGAIASWSGATPERGLFLAQSILSALAAPLAFLVVRAAGGSALLAALATTLLAVDPLGGRIAHGESYFTAQSALLMGAAAALVLGARAGGARLALGVAAAGLLVSQEARVHALGWAPAALLPLAVLALPGSLSRRARDALLATVGVGLVVALTTGGALLATLEGPAGAWSDPALRAMRGHGVPWATLAVGLTILMAARSKRRGAARGLSVVVILLVLTSLASAAPWSEAVWQAHARLYVPALLAPLAAAITGSLRTRRARAALAIAVALPIAVAFALRAPAWTELPTDAREQRIALAWRDELGPDDTVVYVSRAGHHVEELPFQRCVAEHPRAITLRAEEPLPDLSRFAGSLFLAQTSICATSEGSAACRALREQLRPRGLRARQRRELPAIPSAAYLPYDRARIELTLERVGDF